MSYGTGDVDMEPLGPKTVVIHRKNASIFVPKIGRGQEADNLPFMSARTARDMSYRTVKMDLDRSGRKRT